MSWSPETLVVNGVRYVREDVAASRTPEPLERWYRVAELSELSGFTEASIYRAMSSGRLAYKCPNGAKAGRRVSESEWRRYLSAS